MRRIAIIVTLALAGALFARDAAAQCIWGCNCSGSACGCNSNGAGGSCATGGRGCVVTMCAVENRMMLAPDGSVVSLMETREKETSGARALVAPTTVQSRWEYRGPGRSVARHCSGVVVARYFDRSTAAAVRARQRVMTI